MADAEVAAEVATLICAALREDAGMPVVLPAARENQPQPPARAPGGTPRQSEGQPAAHRLATGKVRVIRGP